MTDAPREQLTVESLPRCGERVGRVLWMMEDARRRTLRTLKDLPPHAVDWQPAGPGNSIGSLLYHIAAIETDWLFADILEREIPAAVMEWFPLDVRDEEGRLSRVDGVSLEGHLTRLGEVRQLLLKALTGMADEEFTRLRQLPTYAVSAEWVLHHLAQHEAEHRGQIADIRRQYAAGLAQ